MQSSFLHIPTLTFLTVVLTALLGTLLVVTWSQARSHVALAWWAATFFLGGTGTGLLAARGAIPNFISIEIANGFVILACGCAWAGARSFEHRGTARAWLIYPVFVWIGLCQIPLVASSVPVRVVIISLLMSSYMFLGAHEFWRGRGERLASRWLAIAAMATYGLALISRIPMVAFIDLPAAPVLFQGTSWFGVISVVSLLFIAAMACSILAMSKERMELGYRREAQTDSLTQLFTRRAFLRESEERLLRLKARQEGSAIILLDLDSFKQINDQFGHLIGDAVLQVFADVTRSELRPADVVGRIGGEEFAVFLPMHSAQDAMSVADRMRRSFEEAAREVAGESVRATLSAGVACSGDNPKLITMLSDADRALYAAKQAGRNCVRLANIDVVMEAPSSGKERQQAA